MNKKGCGKEFYLKEFNKYAICGVDKIQTLCESKITERYFLCQECQEKNKESTTPNGIVKELNGTVKCANCGKTKEEHYTVSNSGTKTKHCVINHQVMMGMNFTPQIPQSTKTMVDVVKVPSEETEMSGDVPNGDTWICNTELKSDGVVTNSPDVSGFCLSKEWHNAVYDWKGKRYYLEEDVKEFIRVVLEDIEKNLELNKISYSKVVQILRNRGGKLI